MAVKRLAVTVATTAATGRKRGGDGISQAAVAQRLKLGRKLVAKDAKLNVIVDADGSRAYKRMLAAASGRGRGGKQIDAETLKIAIEH